MACFGLEMGFGNVIDWKAQCCMVLCWQNVSHLLAFEQGQLHRS